MPRFFAVRMARASFGLSAIWCLGCSSFDVLLDALLDGRIAAVETRMSENAPSRTTNALNTVEAAEDAVPSLGCGCDHCVAVRSDASIVASVRHVTPNGVQHESGSALSIDREPLVPPPIAQSAQSAL